MFLVVHPRIEVSSHKGRERDLIEVRDYELPSGHAGRKGISAYNDHRIPASDADRETLNIGHQPTCQNESLKARIHVHSPKALYPKRGMPCVQARVEESQAIRSKERLYTPPNRHPPLIVMIRQQRQRFGQFEEAQDRQSGFASSNETLRQLGTGNNRLWRDLDTVGRKLLREAVPYKRFMRFPVPELGDDHVRNHYSKPSTGSN
ncbi:hypothetical protein MSAR_16160 [Mycolicibacterium sarraceniae]|uniref:Uncharacterized protein n=1 Tax=Mycolicibacterium sarraceniae TaxID=1534348 RepID=A0A7I7SPL6_9MYCO|nr:hypothetical protein MSAR_16160 [Mycolicibacterium sarraceniae]